METTSFGTVQTGTRCGTHPEVTGSVGVSNLLIRSVFNDHNEEMHPGSGISDLENPDTLKKNRDLRVSRAGALNVRHFRPRNTVLAVC